MTTIIKEELKGKNRSSEGRLKVRRGSLPEMEFPTYAVLVNPEEYLVNDLEERLRKGRLQLRG